MKPEQHLAAAGSQIARGKGLNGCSKCVLKGYRNRAAGAAALGTVITLTNERYAVQILARIVSDSAAERLFP